MSVSSKLVELLPEGYGYVIFTACGNVFLNTWMAINVSHARKTHEVPYPTMYSVTSKMFNCIQRAHQNTLESFPHVLFLLMIGGLRFPILSSFAGVVYILGRIQYARGYYSGEPDNRKWGGFMHIGEIILLGTTISVASLTLNITPYAALHSFMESYV